MRSGAWAAFRRRGGVSGAVHDAFRRRLTPAGKAVCWIWFAALAVSRLPGGDGAKIVLLVLSAAMAAAWILSWRAPRMRVEWRLAGPLVAGGRARIEVALAAPSARSPSDPGVWFFRVADGVVLEGDGVHAPRLDADGTARLSIVVNGRFRGPARIEAPHVLLPEPLGLMRSSTRAGEGGELFVRPRAPRVVSFRFLDAGSSAAAFAERLGARRGSGGDPSGVREYRDGDSPRDLHHRAWARLGRPATKERETPRGDGIRLIVSSAAEGIEERMLVDGTLALACALARWLAERGALGQVALDGALVPASDDPVESLLDACARVPRTGWSAGRGPRTPIPPDGGRGPVLVVAGGDPGWIGARRSDAKLVVPDWMTESVSWDASGAVLRYRPDLPFDAEVRL